MGNLLVLTERRVRASAMWAVREVSLVRGEESEREQGPGRVVPGFVGPTGRCRSLFERPSARRVHVFVEAHAVCTAPSVGDASLGVAVA